jgi:hypothetical protein
VVLVRQMICRVDRIIFFDVGERERERVIADASDLRITNPSAWVLVSRSGDGQMIYRDRAGNGGYHLQLNCLGGWREGLESPRSPISIGDTRDSAVSPFFFSPVTVMGVAHFQEEAVPKCLRGQDIPKPRHYPTTTRLGKRQIYIHVSSCYAVF